MTAPICVCIYKWFVLNPYEVQQAIGLEKNPWLSLNYVQIYSLLRPFPSKSPQNDCSAFPLVPSINNMNRKSVAECMHKCGRFYTRDGYSVRTNLGKQSLVRLLRLLVVLLA